MPAGCPAIYEAMLCVNELVVNAIQHSRSGLPGETIEVRIAVVAGEWLRVEVQDAGPLAPAVPAQRGPLDERGRGLALVVSLAEVFGADGGLRWFWMPWAPGVREVWDRQTFAEVIRAAEAAGWAPDSGASRTAPRPPIDPAQLRKSVAPCEVRAARAPSRRRCLMRDPLHPRGEDIMPGFGHRRSGADHRGAGVAPDLPKTTGTGCGMRRPLTMTSTVPEKITCLACRE